MYLEADYLLFSWAGHPFTGNDMYIHGVSRADNSHLQLRTGGVEGAAFTPDVQLLPRREGKGLRQLVRS